MPAFLISSVIPNYSNEAWNGITVGPDDGSGCQEKLSLMVTVVSELQCTFN